MDFSPIISQIVGILWWLLPLAVVIGVLKSPWFKGALGETLVSFAAKLRLPADTYHAIHNVTLPTPDGTTQIDHIFVSRFGVFVVETKNMKGWIFGTERQAQWTQKVFKQTYKFQNPLRQNYKHVKALEAALDVEQGVIQSVVVFVGDSRFKTPMPPNVTYAGGYVSFIKSFRESVLTEAQVERVIANIESGRLQPGRATNREHVQRLKKRAAPDSTILCPKCGSDMVMRTAHRGAKRGYQFWGCSTYPKCRQTLRGF